MKVFISVNTAWNLINFRSGLIKALIQGGHEVVAVAPHDQYASMLPALGCRYEHIGMDNRGTHPGRDLKLLLRYWLMIRRERPDVYLGFTVKPNVYGSLAAHACGVPVVNNIAGLGTAFIRQGWLNKVVRLLYRLALARSARVFFQNAEDKALFESTGIVSCGKTAQLPGSGVDLQRFQPLPSDRDGPVRFLLVARMLWDKGVGTFVEAAHLLHARGVHAEFCLLGFLDVQNPAAISREQVEAWGKDGVITYLGVSDDVRVQLRSADCVVLPSFYREGTPRSLLEAASMARPIITTDTIGCRDVVDDAVTGFLCLPQDAVDLAEKMGRIISMSPAERISMGQRGRAKIEREFDEQIVINRYLKIIDDIGSGQFSDDTTMGRSS